MNFPRSATVERISTKTAQTGTGTHRINGNRCHADIIYLAIGYLEYAFLIKIAIPSFYRIILETGISPTSPFGIAHWVDSFVFFDRLSQCIMELERPWIGLLVRGHDILVYLFCSRILLFSNRLTSNTNALNAWGIPSIYVIVEGSHCCQILPEIW